MKAVLVSLKPYYYYLVGEGIKTIEVRKGVPKSKGWDRDTFFYMSKDEKSFAKIPKEFQEKYRKHFGKVGLRFVCDRIVGYYPYGLRGFELSNEVLKNMCLSNKDLNEYGKLDRVYGWHITDLKVYDKPKELSEFEFPKDNIYLSYRKRNQHFKGITRPPQSWCYVEMLL